MTISLHAHIDRSQSDCDGPTYDSHVEFFNDAEIAEAAAAQGINDFSDIHFMNRVFVNVAGPYAVMHANIEISEGGFQYAETTDEGYRHAEVRWCSDETCKPETTHRDVYAERMGY